MDKRLELQYVLEGIIGNTNVYYNPPTSTTRNYPAIDFSRDDINVAYADNTAYRKTNKYIVTVIDYHVDNPAIEKILDLPMCSFDRHYISDGLHHDVSILYY